MTFLTLLFLLGLAGMCLYIVPIDAKIKQVLLVLILGGVVYWLLRSFGVLPSGIPSIK